MKKIAGITFILLSLIVTGCCSQAEKCRDQVSIAENLDFRIVHTAGRKADAINAKKILASYGFQIKLQGTSASGNQEFTGKIFAHNTNKATAQFIAKAIADIERVQYKDGQKQWSDFYKHDMRLWLVD